VPGVRKKSAERVGAQLDVANLTKRYGRTVSVDRATFQVADGEFFTLLGPSGCGKSTILGMIAGIVEADDGRIHLDGKDITRQPIHRRDVALVFQQYALFPHMTVRDNVAFGLKMKGTPRGELTRRVQEVLQLVQLVDHSYRYPRQLSGGQQQRVALARAIIVKPRVLLLDEPLSNLDAKLRVELRSELREIQLAIRQTTIFVTHDLSEAFEMSDRVAVIAAGRIQQIGTPAELYARPSSIFVAEFLGHSNHVRGQVAGREGLRASAELRIVTGEGWTVRACSDAQQDFGPGETVWLVLPSDRLSLVGAPSGKDVNCIAGTIAKTVFLGGAFRYFVRCSQQTLQVLMQARAAPPYEIGDSVYVEWRSSDSILIGEPGEG
jgi:putative spermidine/putrescine transport system ATP-binding protein